MNKGSFDLTNINSIRPIVRKAFQYCKSGSVLDLGSGVGRHTLFFAKQGFRVTAVEQGSETVAALKELARLQKLPVTLIKGDVTKYAPKKKFDVALSLMVLHFLPQKQQVAMIAMMQSATKKAGINIVSSYTDKNPVETRPHLIKAGSLKKIYEKAGWEILEYVERLSVPMTNSSGKEVRYWVEEIVAKKS